MTDLRSSHHSSQTANSLAAASRTAVSRRAGRQPARQSGSEICLGHLLPGHNNSSTALRILCDAPELRRHAGKPWLNAYLSERMGMPLASATAGEFPGSREATVDADLLSRHALVCGATGSGKTRLALHLMGEQLQQGCSVVILDPKADTLKHVMELAFQAGMPPERVTLLSPFGNGTGAPGWNPLDAQAFGVSPVQAATDFVSVLCKGHPSWGPRLHDILTNALILISTHGLSLFELARLLQRDDYREGLVGLPMPALASHDRIAFLEARDFFRQEFSRWSKSDQTTSVAPVLNKFREFLRVPFLRSLLCARRQTLDFASLWQTPGLVLVHLDAPSLGDEGARLLGGLLTHHLYRTAMRVEGPVPVVLSLDEMGVSERFLGSALSQMLAIARSRNIRLLVACQHLAQLSEELRNALLSNCAVQAFFRLGYADARAVAAALAAGTGEAVSTVAVDVSRRDKEGNPVEFAKWAHPILDACGQRLKLTAPAWTVLEEEKRKGAGFMADGRRQVEGLKRLAMVSGVERLYVRSPVDATPVELSDYVRKLLPGDFEVQGPAPVRLLVSFPRPKVSVISRASESERQQGWLKTLQDLPRRQAVLRLAAGEPGVMEVVAVNDAQSPAGMERFVSAAVARGGQTAREVEEAQEWRRNAVEQVAGGATWEPEARKPSRQRAKAVPPPPSRAALQSHQTPKSQAPPPRSLPAPAVEDGSID